jgi:small GTP-binding protein
MLIQVDCDLKRASSGVSMSSIKEYHHAHDERPFSEDPTYRIALIGDQSVGKSSMIERFADRVYTEQKKATIGVDFRAVRIQFKSGERMMLELYDTAGGKNYDVPLIHTRKADAIIFVYDVKRRETRDSLIEWNRRVMLASPSNNYRPSQLTFIAGNKADLFDGLASTTMPNWESPAPLQIITGPLFSLATEPEIGLHDISTSTKSTLRRQRIGTQNDEYPIDAGVSPSSPIPIACTSNANHDDDDEYVLWSRPCNPHDRERVASKLHNDHPSPEESLHCSITEEVCTRGASPPTTECSLPAWKKTEEASAEHFQANRLCVSLKCCGSMLVSALDGNGIDTLISWVVSECHMARRFEREDAEDHHASPPHGSAASPNSDPSPAAASTPDTDKRSMDDVNAADSTRTTSSPPFRLKPEPQSRTITVDKKGQAMVSGRRERTMQQGGGCC